mmetsp:Transcript_4766/g.5378  ORF Transcript_4766/g.5378 Transcript_4766/m.5378 type:complete len:145 (-) Transcript_4766:378-812(-)|eukprot:CAMPEP_0115008368 /NCGR_PEP_ID=MMETSP0216-20121206/21875_1 /TAXON_ID=223996 /ORGANISM="Protocruzia adherens, Strain Boccale" /LENGTH=144 /DNA_ID=CAMNT_0002375771 /DNA_START=107 /DNA_END=541 /DNA_ORIENTATION=+
MTDKAQKREPLELLLLIGGIIVAVCILYFGAECAEPITTAIFLVAAKWICLSFISTFIHSRCLSILVGSFFALIEGYYAYAVFKLIGSTCDNGGFSIVIFLVLCIDIISTLIVRKSPNGDEDQKQAHEEPLLPQSVGIKRQLLI